MKFCSQCGAEVIIRVPADDNRERYICDSCDTVHYQNPKVITGCIPVWEDKILLCRRAIEPRSGFWTLPAGFMELGETITEAALRETLEEADARVAILNLYVVLTLPHVNQVHMLFRSRLQDLNYKAGAETTEVNLFAEDEIPWSELAFGSIRHTLKFYFADRKKDKYPLHVGDLVKAGNEFVLRPGPADDQLID